MNKTKSQLVNELQELLQKNEQLQTLYEREIKEHKKETEMLWASEQQLSSIYNTVKDIIFYLTVEADEKYRFTSINQAFCTVTGLTQEQVLGKTVTEVIPEPSLTMVIGKYKQAIDEKKIIQWEEISDYPRGQVVGQVSIAPVYNDDGVCTNLVGSVNDITELKKKEAQLLFINKAIESSTEAISISDTQGHFLFHNKAFSELFGYSDIKELDSIGGFKALIEDQLIAEEIYKNIRIGKSWSGELKMVTKSGMIFPAFKNADAIHDSEGKIIGLIGINKDLTELKMTAIKLQRSEERYLKLMENRKEGVCFLDDKDIFMVVNPSAEKIFGINKGELTGKCLSDFLCDETVEIVKNETQKRSQGESSDYEHEIVLKDGIKKDILISASPIFDSIGFIGTFAIINDITQSKQAEKELRDSELKYRLLFENMEEGFTLHEIITDESGLPVDFRFLDINAAYERHTGLKSADCTGRTIREIMPKADPVQIENYGKVALTGKPLFFEYYSTIFNRHLRVHAFCPQPRQFATIFEDITELKLANQALEESEEKYRVLLESSILGIVAFDIETHQCTFSNSAACKLFGYSEEEIIRLNIADFHPKESIEKVISEFESQGRGEKSISSALPCLRKDGTIFLADIAGYTTTLNGRNCSIGFIMDVTERKKAEALIEQTRQNYETFFNTIDEFLFVLDEQGNVIHANSTVYDRLGYTRDELFGKSVLMIHPPDHRDEAGRIVGEMLMGAALFCPIPVQSKSGVQIPVETRVTRGFWNGKPAIFGVTKDISQVRLSEEKFSKLFHINPSACGLSDLETNQYIEVNEVFYKLFGFKKSEVLGKTAYELNILTPELSKAILKHADSNGRVINVEANLKAKNGDIKHVLLSAENIYIQDKKYRFTVVHDITELKHFENVLKERETSLREAQEVARLGSFVWDIKGGLWTSSNILDDIFGIDETFVRSLEGWASLIHTDWREIMTDYVVNEVLGKHQRFDKEYKIINQRSGEELWVHGLAELKIDENNQPGILIGTITNINQRKQFEESLQQTQLFLNSIIEHSPNSMWISDERGTLIRLNQACRDNLHLKDDEVVGKYNIFEDTLLIEQGFIPMVKDVFKKGLTAHFIIQYDTSAVKNLNLEQTIKVFLEVHISPIVNSQGKVTNAVIQHNDITERKLIEQELTESEEKYRVLLNGSSYGILAIDIETQQFLFSNPAICKLFGYTDKEFQRLRIANLVQKESFDLVMSEFASQMRGEKPVSFSQPCIRKDGTTFYADIAGAPIVLNGRKCSVGFFNDVSDRKIAEDKIREKDIQFRKLSSNLPDLIFQFSRRPDGTYCVPIASEGIKNIFGCSPEDVVDDFTPIGRVIFHEDAERVISDIEYSAKHLTYFTCEFRVQIPGKPIQWIFSRSTPEKLEDGSVTWYGFNANITEMKQTEMELIKAKEKAEESDRLKSAFLANMSHEIRTPMNGILGFAELLKEPHLTGEEQQQYLSIIERSGNRMLNIINDIVSISKIESGQMEITISEIKIKEQMEFIYSFFKSKAEKKGLQFSVKNPLPSKEAIIKSDREKIYAILTNLVNNAIKYTKAGSIEFGYEKKGKFLEFFVKDTGSGVSEQQREIIFERFRQGNDLIAHFTEGTGLGLSISKSYVEMLGGQIWVESELGKGSTFFFTLPFNDVANMEISNMDGSSLFKVDYQSKDLKILVFEDDEDSLQLMTTILKKIGKELLQARTGIEALATCRANPDLDLIFMDVKMPEIDGHEATRQIRQFNKDVIIIAQTANAMVGDREKAIEAGCNDYISKPISTNILKALIQKHFNNWQ